MAVAAPLAAAASIAATGLSAWQAIAQGNAAADGETYRAGQAMRAATYGRIKADQTATQMGEALTNTLSNIDAVRASANTVQDSPTGQIMRNYSEFLGERDRRIKVGNLNAQADSDEAASSFYMKSARNAIFGSYLGAGGRLLGGLGGVNWGAFGG
jgi:hypothetical protein